jgi:hypothetical protein
LPIEGFMLASGAEGDEQRPTIGLAEVKFVGYLRQVPHVAGPQRKESEDQRKEFNRSRRFAV